MRSNIKLGRISGIEIGLHYSWFIIATLIFFSLGERFRHVNPTGVRERSGARHCSPLRCSLSACCCMNSPIRWLLRRVD